MRRFEGCTVHFVILFGSLLLSAFTGDSQIAGYMPGPANADTLRYAHIYFLREQTDSFPDNWVGVIMQDDQGLCVKARMNAIYRVNTMRSGQTVFWTRISGVKREITIDLRPGSSHYVQIVPGREEDGSINAKMVLLDEPGAMSRIANFKGKIQDRYCILPYLEGNHDFRENFWSDTVSWYASKHFIYRFLPLPSWEVILRSPLQTVLSFRNKLISETYSELGGVRYLNLKKCRSEAELENYATGKFLSLITDKRLDTDVRVQIKPINLPSGFTYARMLSLESESQSEVIKGKGPLKTRSVFILFHWKDGRGKGVSAALYISERGLLEELHDLQELEERISRSWESFSLAEIAGKR